jgi:hypothetical protein
MTENLNKNEARQGRPHKMVRQTLAWSLPLAIIGLAAVVFLFLF